MAWNGNGDKACSAFVLHMSAPTPLFQMTCSLACVPFDWRSTAKPAQPLVVNEAKKERGTLVLRTKSSYLSPLPPEVPAGG